MKTILETKYYNVKELSSMIGLSETTIRNYFKDKLIPAKKIGNSWYTTEEDLRNYLNNNIFTAE